MKFFARSVDVTKTEADLLAVFAMDDKVSRPIFTQEANVVDKELGGMLTEVAKTERFEAKNGNTLLIHTHGKIPSARVLLVGLGKPEELTVFDLQTLGAIVGRKTQGVSGKKVAISLPKELLEKFDASVVAQSFTEGITLGTYVFHKLKHKDVQIKHIPLEEVNLLTTSLVESVAIGIAKGEIVARAVTMARDLVNEPPSTTTPTYLANVARDIVKGQSNMKCTVFDKQNMQDMGMEALLGIAQGSDEEPKFIHLEYNGGSVKPVVIVGKGITFDTGGLSLKPSSGMETMKLDMAGAACVLGVFQALKEFKPKINVVGLIAATENMPSGKAIKPGDIVRAMNGKTIEVLNTDAEGRVVLADAFSYAGVKVKPKIMIDLATLTGACMVALGEDISGLFSNDDALASSLQKSAKDSGEKVWKLPLAKEYKKDLESTVADVKNVAAGKYGGAINGALFLEEFVPKGTKWAHLDIAGPSFIEKDAPLTPRGGTGVGVRMILEYLLSSS